MGSRMRVIGPAVFSSLISPRSSLSVADSRTMRLATGIVKRNELPSPLLQRRDEEKTTFRQRLRLGNLIPHAEIPHAMFTAGTSRLSGYSSRTSTTTWSMLIAAV